MTQNPQEQHESTIDSKLELAKKAMGTHNGTRPSQNPQPDWNQIEEAVNGKLKR
jgi:hypothetical protein